MARVLVVDDEELVRGTIAAVLRRAGCTATTATDGLDALRQFLPGCYDLVITDIIIPRMEGIETMRALRRIEPAIRIVAMSGGNGGDHGFYLKAAVALGADATLCKPFTISDLRLIVEDALATQQDNTASLWYREMPDWASPVQRNSRPVESASNAARSSAPK